MTLFIRNKKNKSIVDIDLWIKNEGKRDYVELRSSVIIDTYSELLLNNLDRKDEIVKDYLQLRQYL